MVVEQREAQALEPGSMLIHDEDDEQIRARDGFSLLFELWPGSAAKCPHCGERVSIIPGKVKSYNCDACKANGRSSNHVNVAGFYPDSEGLIQELRKLDFISHNALDPRERLRQFHAKNTYRRERNEFNIVDDRAAYGRENWRWLTGTPRTGYTGREHAR